MNDTTTQTLTDLNVRIAKARVKNDECFALIRGGVYGEIPLDALYKEFEQGRHVVFVEYSGEASGNYVEIYRTPGRGELYEPDSSLDLMHELIAELTDEEYQQYLFAMDVETANDLTTDPFTIDYAVMRALTEATAAQKAEAWLQVKGG